MSKTSEMIDYIIGVGLHPALKRERFLKSSRTFRRCQPGCIQIVNVQGSWTNFDDKGRFTVNLGVYFPEAARIDGEFQVTERPSAQDCIVQERIGNLMPDRHDYWWSFDPTSSLEEIAHELTLACMCYGLPWLDAHSTIEGALKFLQIQKIPKWVANFSRLLDNREDTTQ